MALVRKAKATRDVQVTSLYVRVSPSFFSRSMLQARNVSVLRITIAPEIAVVNINTKLVYVLT